MDVRQIKGYKFVWGAQREGNMAAGDAIYARNGMPVKSFEGGYLIDDDCE